MKSSGFSACAGFGFVRSLGNCQITEKALKSHQLTFKDTSSPEGDQLRPAHGEVITIEFRQVDEQRWEASPS